MVELKLVVAVGEKGQVVIPKPIRDLLNITPKSEVTFSVSGGKVVVEKKTAAEILSQFLAAGRPKPKAPKHINWDGLYASQFS